MTPDEHRPESDRSDQGVGDDRGLVETVEAALRGNDPAIEVAGLRVAGGDDAMPVIQGRVGSEKDRQWALALAREALGREVHDGLQIDESVPSSAPSEVTSGFEDEGGTDPEVDATQGATGLLGSGVDPRRPRLPGQEDEHLGDRRPAREYVAPGLEEQNTPEPPLSG
ncbi:MAG TPA: BON domain-containing protein [Actinomycetota bacterium]|jgi:hypothetical protein|nr:BON domain-containing protein [Actinomycetota bacterium]